MFSVTYLVAMVAINVGFAHGVPGMAFAVGLVFVLRDLAQRELGHRVLGFMLLGAWLSYLMASPAVAFASCAAYLVGETVDWIVYTVTRRPLADRVLLSCLAATPLDSAVFLALIGAFSWSGVAAMTASKLVAALLVFVFLRARRVPA